MSCFSAVRHPAHDRKAKSEAKAFAALGSFAAFELLENQFALGSGDARARIINGNADLAAARPRANQHMTDFRIANSVGGKVLHNAPQHQRIGHDPEARPPETQRDALIDRQGQQTDRRRN